MEPELVGTKKAASGSEVKLKDVAVRKDTNFISSGTVIQDRMFIGIMDVHTLFGISQHIGDQELGS